MKIGRIRELMGTTTHNTNQTSIYNICKIARGEPKYLINVLRPTRTSTLLKINYLERVNIVQLLHPILFMYIGYMSEMCLNQTELMIRCVS